MYKKHNYLDRLRYMALLEDGYSTHYVHKKFGIDKEQLIVLKMLYDQGGPEALKKRPPTQADVQTKLSAILDFDPNQKWTTDVTEVKIKDKKIYLSPILDMFNGEIISYTISYHPDLKMTMSMLDKAFKKTDIPKGLILHSDQGWHYQHLRYQKALKDRNIVQSMSRKGNCLDNAMMENFFGLMKSELFYLQEWDSVEQFAKELVKLS